MGFAGTIPPQLGNLSFLISLDMSNNNFHGHLPEGMSHLCRLSFMALSNNNLTGEIPSWLGVLERLQYLSLTENNFFGELPANICDNLPNLKELDLSWNQLSGQILSGLSNCSGLKSLDLSVNQFNGYIPKAVGNLKMLEELDLGDNNLEGSIPEGIGNLQSLRVLSITSSNLSGSIPREIGNLTMLEEVYFFNNSLTGDPIGGEKFLIFAGSVNNCPIPNEIGNLLKSEGLGLGENRRSSIKYVEEIHLGWNNFSGAIPASISNCSKLIEINLHSNKFSGPIPNSIGNLRRLESLSLSANNLTSESSSPELGLFTSLTGCISLWEIWVADNPLNGVLPRSIGNLSISVERLMVGNCGLKGNIPESIGNLSNLAYLFLDDNILTGSIPSTMGLQNLRELGLTNMSLTGPLPRGLCGLQSLEDLGLSQNQISGSIPGCFNNLTSLMVLDIAFNRLTSTLPTSLWVEAHRCSCAAGRAPAAGNCWRTGGHAQGGKLLARPARAGCSPRLQLLLAALVARAECTLVLLESWPGLGFALELLRWKAANCAARARWWLAARGKAAPAARELAVGRRSGGDSSGAVRRVGLEAAASCCGAGLWSLGRQLSWICCSGGSDRAVELRAGRRRWCCSGAMVRAARGDGSSATSYGEIGGALGGGG
ncbi:probable leucine-rich repeat receptor-like protein kinase At5g63930 [Coffea eugenioides]|uniref:probable leucine-rich repeat receptor-like protein kinase At5g63930 n=1 Tax=Coffea eugenioides TaxID=49369 RepID=UPI000F6101D5|nr:probable leucine-rich repeat receptor-like protein kinase At5g63930 [Coffea eugenioides]